MYAWGPVIQKLRSGESAGPSEELRVAVTFCRPGGLPGPVKSGIPLTLNNVKDFVPEEDKMNQGIDALSKLGFKLTGRGQLTASMKCTKKSFETAFDTKLTEFQLDAKENYAFYSFYFPPDNLPWTPILEELIDDVYIQWPHMYMAPKKSTSSRKKVASKSSAVGGQALPSAQPPKVNYYHLKVPSGVASLLNAKEVHLSGTTGKGIRVVMIDSGFAHGSHRFFDVNRYTSKVVLAGDAQDQNKDYFGHGTGQSANLFSLAPRAEFIGVKIEANNISDMFDINPASLLEGFYTACIQNPDIISISAGFDMRDKESKKQRSTLPNSLKALEAEILHAVASGISVVVAAGNGGFSFPAMMPDVISAGGVFVDQDRNMRASDLASAFDSKIYPDRHVPDVCGLVGMEEDEDRYIMLPIPPGCLIDIAKGVDPKSETTTNDGWAAFSGTSAAAPQIAGVCALLKEKNPKLKPWDIKTVLRSTAREVLAGHSNPKSSDGGMPKKAGPGYNGATGSGLVDAFRAWKQV